MILFFKSTSKNIFAVGTSEKPSQNEIEKLIWLFSGAVLSDSEILEGSFIGPRKEMITPWSTNAVEITQNMAIHGIMRIEEFHPVTIEKPAWDPMLKSLYKDLDQHLFTIDKLPDPVLNIDDIRKYNHKEGLALNDDEIT